LLSALTACRSEQYDLTRTPQPPTEAPVEVFGPDAKSFVDGAHRTAFGVDTIEFKVKAGRKEGYAKSYHTNGVLHRQGEFVNDLPHGWWEEYDPQERLCAAGHYIAGRKQGLWRIQDPAMLDGTHLAHEARPALHYSCEHPLAEGPYHQGMPHGYWRFFDPDGSVRSEGDLHEGYMTGWWRVNDPHGMPAHEGQFVRSEPSGFQRFYTGGLLHKEGNYEGGRPTGNWTIYNEHGEPVQLVEHD
jgi:antitoxin component YwqK of YwqJK toxin-antitoxin module